MSKTRSFPPKSVPSSKPENIADDAANIEQQLTELQQLLAKKQAEALQKSVEQINALAQQQHIGIGIRLNLPKLFDIIAYMVRTGKQEISLQYEVWPDPQPATSNQ